MTDLTRWNRSGLSRLRYVQGNAATYLELIRAELAKRFPERWQQQLRAPFTDQDFANVEERWHDNLRNDHLIAQYQGERGDLAWELLRAFVRSCHVLTEHIDAHANEAFLRTATEWDDLRKMVAMLGYHPVGAISATTLLTIEARAKGKLERGLQVRYRAPGNDRSIVFETLDDIDLDPALNLFRVQGRERSTRSLAEVSDGAPRWPVPKRARVRVGESALLIDECGPEESVASARVDAVDDQAMTLSLAGNEWGSFVSGCCRLYSSPQFRRKPWINGPKVRRSVTPHGLSKGDVVAWKRMSDQEWRFAMVRRADVFGLELETPQYVTELLGPEGVKRQFWIPKADDATSNKQPNDQWPDPDGVDDIVLRPAARISGTLVVPADSLDEVAIGQLGSFGVEHLMKIKGLVETTDNKLQFDDKFNELELKNTDANNLDDFIKWLLGAVMFSFPIAPDVLVKLGAAIMTKDARIPSTGQLVYEAFLSLFGAGGDKGVSFSGDPPVPDGPMQPLFRYWTDGTDFDGSGRIPIAKGLDGKPAPGELWYLARPHEGGGLPERELAIINERDHHWYFFDGSPAGLQVGDWAAARFAGSDHDVWRPVKILSVEPDVHRHPQSQQVFTRHEHRSAFAVELELPADLQHDDSPELLELQGGYRTQATPPGAELNDAELGEWIPLDPAPEVELAGRTLLAQAGDRLQLVRVEETKSAAVRIEPPLPAGFTQGNLRLYGNVVRAGHGQRQPDARLDGGTIAGRQSRLLLERRLVSTIPDESANHGARADIELSIDGARWHEVPRLDASRPTDRHFTTTTTEEGYLELLFGDGRHGRALPIGTNNVQVRHRVGAGAVDVPAGSLETLVHPHPLVLSVRQPLPATGGADMEAPEHMRERAPAALLALDRAVSSDDFEQLAMQHHGVAQARASYRVADGSRHERIELIVVPAGDGTLAQHELDAIATHLEQRALPNVQVQVALASEVEIEVEIEIRVDIMVHDREPVRRAVTRAVADALGRSRRTVGADLHLSEVYAVVEATAGVEHSVCKFVGSSDESVGAGPVEIVFIPRESAVFCRAEVYTP